MYFVLLKVVYKQSDDNSRRVYALRGSLRDIPTLWNFSGCFIKTKWTQCYSIEQKIIICLTTFLFCFLKQSYSFWGSSSSAHFLSLSPQMYRWSGHDLTSCYTTRNLKLQKWRKLEKNSSFGQSSKTTLVNTLGWLHSQQWLQFGQA